MLWNFLLIFCVCVTILHMYIYDYKNFSLFSSVCQRCPWVVPYWKKLKIFNFCVLCMALHTQNFLKIICQNFLKSGNFLKYGISSLLAKCSLYETWHPVVIVFVCFVVFCLFIVCFVLLLFVVVAGFHFKCSLSAQVTSFFGSQLLLLNWQLNKLR